MREKNKYISIHKFTCNFRLQIKRKEDNLIITYKISRNSKQSGCPIYFKSILYEK